MSSPIPSLHAHSPQPHTIQLTRLPSAPRLNLLLRPSHSLGPFRLGLSLWHTIDYLRSHQSLFPQFNIIYDQVEPRLSPIVVAIKPHLYLVFDGTSQRLTVITLDNLDPEGVQHVDPSNRPVHLFYNGKLIHAPPSANTPPVQLTRSSLHQILGPTYPGWSQRRTDGLHDSAATAAAAAGANGKNKNQKPASSEQSEFVLAYPGVAFTFIKKGSDTGHAKGKPSRDAEIDKDQPVSSIHIFSGSDPKEPEDVILLPSSRSRAPSPTTSGNGAPTLGKHKGTLSPPAAAAADCISAALADAEKAALCTDAINIRAPNLVDAVIEAGKRVTLKFSTDTVVELTIGRTTTQDALCELGSPQRIFYKEDDRLRIHGRGSHVPESGEDKARQDEGSPFFYNYFDLGLDLLFSGTSGRLEKVVCHTNVAGDALFQRYNRCPWRVEGEYAYVDGFKGGQGAGALSMELDRGTCAEMGGRGAGGERAVKLDLGTELVGREGLVLEVGRDDSVVSVVVF